MSLASFNSSGDWTLSSVVFMSSWLSIVIFIGIFGNILVIFVSLQGTRVRTRGKSLIVSMAFADMLESVNMICVLVTSIKYGEWIFGDIMCNIHAFITTEFVVASMYSLMAISVNRYFMVVKSSQYKKFFNDRNLIFIVLFIWVFPLILSIPPLIGWSRYDFQSNKATCIFFFSTDPSYSLIVIALCVPFPLSTILFCCYKVFIEVRHHKRRVNNIRGKGPVNVEEIRITKTLIIIIMAYLVCFIPPAVANLVEMVVPDYQIPFWVDLISMSLVFTNHANNPLIYGFFNRQYRRAFKELLFQFLPGNYLVSTSGESVIESRTQNITGIVSTRPVRNCASTVN